MLAFVVVEGLENVFVSSGSSDRNTVVEKISGAAVS